MHDQRERTGPAHAEVAEVWPRDGRIRVIGHAVGAPSGTGTLVVRLRGAEDTELRLPAEGRDTRFEAAVPLAELAAATPDGERVWDLYLAPDGHDGTLRLGRHLDDVRGKKKIFTYPAQRAAGREFEPYYTVQDNLSIACDRGGGR
ncbi:hypothetical protein C3486_01260 [Streptomyces sp. Ru73]|uniref:hypothetical protein n=1 Tax=Streptomyces sp. Ru73 TaxID=2080748 RepID=UPI000CDD25E9|nr:hypothetical protein [Streptomyces sp. Ru73]POX43209.1 hypothetical protein C3486_01260 [Streptomyces sp. Ru73]